MISGVEQIEPRIVEYHVRIYISKPHLRSDGAGQVRGGHSVRRVALVWAASSLTAESSVRRVLTASLRISHPGASTQPSHSLNTVHFTKVSCSCFLKRSNESCCEFKRLPDTSSWNETDIRLIFQTGYRFGLAKKKTKVVDRVCIGCSAQRLQTHVQVV